jgi:hypothetical protein
MLEIPSCLVKCSPEASDKNQGLIEHPIKVLKLNSDDNMVQERLDIIKDYSQGHIDFDFLERRYPFIAYELLRQNMRDDIKNFIKTINGNLN